MNHVYEFEYVAAGFLHSVKSTFPFLEYLACHIWNGKFKLNVILTISYRNFCLSKIFDNVLTSYFHYFEISQMFFHTYFISL